MLVEVEGLPSSQHTVWDVRKYSHSSNLLKLGQVGLGLMDPSPLSSSMVYRFDDRVSLSSAGLVESASSLLVINTFSVSAGWQLFSFPSIYDSYRLSVVLILLM